jgi:pimeloyl-ACP methyl ester carboxylesterase
LTQAIDARGVGISSFYRHELFSMRSVACAVNLVLLLLAAGCAERPVNASFAVSSDQARDALRVMAKQPKPLNRPLVIVGGYDDPGFGMMLLHGQLDPVIRDRRVVTVDLAFAMTFDDCRRQILAAVDHAYPTDDAVRTREVDVIGISMGGLAARYAATPKPGKRVLAVSRLFTISSPLRGATLATLPTFDSKHIDMRRGSRFLKALAAAESTTPAYELVPYVRLRDGIVGAANAAPEGRTAWWVPVGALDLSHMCAPADPRIVADIVRRLRDEEPFTTDPPAPLPSS